MRLVAYIDDILVIAGSQKLARDHTVTLIFLLKNLSFIVHPEKSITNTSRTCGIFSRCPHQGSFHDTCKLLLVVDELPLRSLAFGKQFLALRCKFQDNKFESIHICELICKKGSLHAKIEFRYFALGLKYVYIPYILCWFDVRSDLHSGVIRYCIICVYD